MKTFAKTLVATGFVGTLGAAPALADYTILEDPAYPSVLFFEIEGPEPAAAPVAALGTPTVIGAPSASVSADPGMAFPGDDTGGPAQSTSSDGGSGDSEIQGIVENRLDTLQNNPGQIEVENAVDTIILQDSELR